MQYKLKFGNGGDIKSWKECRNPASGQWVPSQKRFGFLGPPGASGDWHVGSQHLILEAQHVREIIKGLRKNFADIKFILPSSEGIVHIKHQYWQSPTRQSTLTLVNMTRPGYRAMAEKAQHRHRIVLGTGSISHRSDWSVSCFGMMTITGEQLAAAIEGKKASLTRAGNINEDVIEEALALGAMIGDFFT
jgi:hypothetical protein